MKKNKVSIIIPAYNSELYIKETLDSVLAQTYNNLEIIIVDDGSKDNTGDIADEYGRKDERLIVIHQKNSGSPAARNAGIKVSTGDYLFFLDSDDWIETNCIQNLVECQFKNNADIVFFSYYREYQNKSEEYHVYKNESVYKKNADSELYLYDMRLITAWGKLYTRKVLENHLYDEKMRTAEDVDFNYRVYENVETAIYLPECLLHYRVLQKSAIHGYDPKVEEKFLYPVSEVRKRLSEGTDDQKKAYFSFAAIAYIVIIQNGISLNNGITYFDKINKIKNFQEIDWVKELFANSKYIRIPLSRKALIIFGKIRFYSLVLLAIEIKKIIKG